MNSSPLGSKQTISVEQQQEQTSSKAKVKQQITAEEMKIMTKKVLRYDKLKTEYDKLKTQYENIKREWQRISLELAQSNEQSLIIRNQLRNENQKNEKLKIDNQILVKRQQKFVREEQRIKQTMRIEKQLTNRTKQQMNTLRQTVVQVFTLKQQLNRLANERVEMKMQVQEYFLLKQKCSSFEQKVQSMQMTMKQNMEQMQMKKILIDKLQKRVNNLIEEKKEINRLIEMEKEQSQGLKERLSELEGAIEEQRTTYGVEKNRFLIEIKSLKQELQKQREKVAQKQKVNVMKWSEMTRDDLFNMLEQLQTKNSLLQRSLIQIAEAQYQKGIKIEQQKNVIVMMSKEMMKNFPTLEESEGVNFIDKITFQNIVQNKKEQSDVIEKIIIQNIRLKASITQLGKQYNQLIRKKQE